MDNKIQAFFQSLKGKRVAFIGIGVSHTELIGLFARKGIEVFALDKADRETIGRQRCAELTALGVTLVLGERYLDHLETYDVVFRTPGMYYYHPALVKARENGVAVTSEMEVFFQFCPCKIYGVTGSDGKTTTTTLISEMLKAQGYRVHIGGNIGIALLPIIEQITPEDRAVVELSSFQLISMRQSPDVAVVTNVTPNHLDVHGTMEEYIDAKRNLYLHQNAFSRTVLGAANEVSNSFAEGGARRMHEV